MARSEGADQLEVTTCRVCPVNCKPYCPQEKFRDAYGGVGQEMLSYENFARAISTVPPEVWIGFAGFSEPFLNPRCVDMMELAHDQGHPLTLYTTLVGAKLEDVPRVAALEVEELVRHTRDNQGVAKIPDTDQYREVFARVLDTWRIHDVSVMNVGFDSNERAGNCDGAPPRHVVGPLSCYKLDRPNFVMLPNGDCVLCCFHPETRVFVRLKLRGRRLPFTAALTFAEIARVERQATVEGMWSSYRGAWRPSRLVRSANPGLVRVVMENGAIFHPTLNHEFLVKEYGSEAAPQIPRTAATLRPGDLLPFDLAGMADAPGVGDRDLGRFVGLYLAEGAAHEMFYLGDNERETGIARFLMSFGSERFGARGYWTHQGSRPESHTTYVRFGGSQAVRGVLADFTEGRDFKTKRIRQECFDGSAAFRAGVIAGLWDGDGQERSNASILTLANPLLAEQATHLMASIGAPYTLNQRQYVSKAGNDVAVVNRVKTPNRDAEAMRGKYAFPVWAEGLAWCRIRSVEQVGKMGCRQAYCFEVLEGDPYFTLASGFAVHNCMDWTLRHRVGNLVRQSYTDLVRSAEFRRVVAQARDPDGDALCRSCKWAKPRGSP